MKVQQGLDKVWRWFGEDRRLLEILIALLVIQGMGLIIPQAPVPRTDGPGYSRWIAELRPTLNVWTTPLSTLGLLTLRTSLWTRGILVILVLIVVVRSGSLVETVQAFASLRKWLYGLLCLSSLLIITGWGLQTARGWKQSEVIAWPDMEIIISERGLTLPPQNGNVRLWTGYYGLYFVPRGTSIGLEVQAFDGQGEVLALLSSARSDPQEKLYIALTTETPEAYFALPDVGLVFRVSRIQGSDTHIQAQVYRSASGELLAETVLQGDGSLFANDIRLKLERYVLPHFEAVYNPGAVFEGLGMLMLIATIVGQGHISRKMAPQGSQNDRADVKE
jgi:hypothetical protein